MTACDLLNVTMGSKLYSYLESKPQNYDVTFAVGPEKTSVKALKVILKSSSVIFETEFEDKWEQSVLKEGEGIPLPEFDPEAFKLFIKLLILDTWSVDALKELSMPANQLMNLLSICRRYEITIAIQNLQSLFQDFLRTFDCFLRTDDFLHLSKNNFETILLNEHLIINEAEVVAGALRWAEKQCELQNLEPKGENYREVLGSVLFRIRFPAMTFQEFRKVLQMDNFLTDKEIIETCKVIGLENEEILNCDTNNLPFKVNRRTKLLHPSLDGFSVLSATKLFQVDDCTPFVCDGAGGSYHELVDKQGLTLLSNADIKYQKTRFASVNHKIAVCGFGFLGPIDADSFYDVTVRIDRYGPGRTTLVTKSVQKVFARKKEIFYIFLDQPFSLDVIQNSGTSNCYEINFCLKGPHSQSLRANRTWNELQDGDTKFKLRWQRNQLAEMLYKKTL